MEKYKPSNRFKLKDLITITITLLPAALIIALITNFITDLIGFSLIIIMPIAQVYLIIILINKVITNRPIRSPIIMGLIGLTIGLILYLTPHVILYEQIKTIIIDEAIIEYNLTNNNLSSDLMRDVVGQFIDFNAIDYFILRTEIGTSVGRVGRSNSNWGAFGFIITEIIDIVILILVPLLTLHGIAKKPFSEKKKQWHKNILPMLVKPDDLTQLSEELKNNPDTKKLKSTINKGVYLDKKEKSSVIQLMGIDDEYSLKINDDYYLLNKKEGQTIEKEITKEYKKIIKSTKEKQTN